MTSVRDGMNLVSHEYVAAQEALTDLQPLEPGSDDDEPSRKRAPPSVVEAGAGS